MKKCYTMPEVEMNVLTIEDIIMASFDENETDPIRPGLPGTGGGSGGGDEGGGGNNETPLA